LSLDRVTIANFVSGVFVRVTVCVGFIDSISEFVIFYGFFMVWSSMGWGIGSRMGWGIGSRMGWGIGSRSVVDGGVVDGDREMVGGSMVWSSMKGSMVWISMKGSMVYTMVYRGCMMERGSMVYKWCSVVHRSGMEGCVVYRGTEDTVVNWGSVKGVGMGMGGKSDIAFGTKGIMGVLVGYTGVMTLVLVG